MRIFVLVISMPIPGRPGEQDIKVSVHTYHNEAEHELYNFVRDQLREVPPWEMPNNFRVEAQPFDIVHDFFRSKGGRYILHHAEIPDPPAIIAEAPAQKPDNSDTVELQAHELEVIKTAIENFEYKKVANICEVSPKEGQKIVVRILDKLE